MCRADGAWVSEARIGGGHSLFCGGWLPWGDNRWAGVRKCNPEYAGNLMLAAVAHGCYSSVQV